MIEDKKDIQGLSLDSPCIESQRYMFSGGPYAIREYNYFPYDYVDIFLLVGEDTEEWMDEQNNPYIIMNSPGWLDDRKNRTPGMI